MTGSWPTPRLLRKGGRKLAGRMSFAGMDISIETDAGQQRHWHDPFSGRSGATTMRVPYGYIRRTEGEDGEQVDVFVGPDQAAPFAFIVHQMKAPDFTDYDEDKVFIGLRTPDEAQALYLQHYDDPRFLGSMSVMPIEHFRRLFVKGGVAVDSLNDPHAHGRRDAVSPVEFDQAARRIGAREERFATHDPNMSPDVPAMSKAAEDPRLPPSLAALTVESLEGLCTRCGLCCFSSVEVPDGRQMLVPELHCQFAELGESATGAPEARCTVYGERHELAKSWCMPLAKALARGAMPDACPYVQNIPGYKGAFVPDADLYVNLKPVIRKALSPDGDKPAWARADQWEAFSRS